MVVNSRIESRSAAEAQVFCMHTISGTSLWGPLAMFYSRCEFSTAIIPFILISELSSVERFAERGELGLSPSWKLFLQPSRGACCDGGGLCCAETVVIEAVKASLRLAFGRRCILQLDDDLVGNVVELLIIENSHLDAWLEDRRQLCVIGIGSHQGTKVVLLIKQRELPENVRVPAPLLSVPGGRLAARLVGLDFSMMGRLSTSLVGSLNLPSS